MSETFDSDDTYCSIFEKAKKKVKQRKPRKVKSTTLLQEISKKVELHLEGKHLLGNQEVITYMKELSKIKTNKYNVEKYKSILNTVYKKNKTFETVAALSQKRNDFIEDCRISQDLEMLAKGKNNLKSILSKIAENNSLHFETNMLTNQNFLSINNSSEMFEANSSTLDKRILIPNKKDLPCILRNKQSSVNTVSFQNSELNDSQLLPVPTKLSQKLKDSTLHLRNKKNNDQFQSKTDTEMENTISPILDTTRISNQTLTTEKNIEELIPFNSTTTKVMPTLNYSDLPGLMTNQNFTYTSDVRNTARSQPVNKESYQNYNDSFNKENVYNIESVSNQNYPIIDNNIKNCNTLVAADIQKDGIEFLITTNGNSKLIQSPSLHFTTNSDKPFENILATEQTNEGYTLDNNYSILFSEDLFASQNAAVKSLETTDMLISHNDKMIVVNTNNITNPKSNRTNLTGEKLCELNAKCPQNVTLTKNHFLKGKESADLFSENILTDDCQTQKSEKVPNFSTNNSCQILISDSFCDKMDIDSSISINSSDSRAVTSTTEPKGTFKKPSVLSKMKMMSNNNMTTMNKKETQNIDAPENHFSANCNNTQAMDSMLLKEKTLEESCEDLCKLTRKFLKIGDESNGDESSPGFNLLKGIAKPRHKKDYQGAIELGTGSVNWDDSSESIEETSQLHQEISDLLVEILKNIHYEQQNKIRDKEALLNQVSSCLDPKDVTGLDLNNLIISNSLRIQQIANIFKDQLLTENIQPYFEDKKDNEEELLYYDWRNI